MGGLVLIVCLVLVLHYSDMVCLGKSRAKAIVGNYYLGFCCFFFPALTSVKHLDVLLLSKSLYSSHIALLCFFILSLCMFRLVHANSTCGHVSIDWVLHSVQSLEENHLSMVALLC
jgi:hypothetical protein